VNFLMLNPSKATATEPDPTITRCVGFARAWGFDGLIVTNLFALRSTDPDGLKAAADPVGPDNDAAILAAAEESVIVIGAWGIRGDYLGRSKAVRGLLTQAGITLRCLSQCANGEPGHPLYLAGSLTPILVDPLLFKRDDLPEESTS
jgi:hypothetical protein